MLINLVVLNIDTQIETEGVHVFMQQILMMFVTVLYSRPIFSTTLEQIDPKFSIEQTFKTKKYQN